MHSLSLRAVIVWGLVLIVVVLGGSAAVLYLRNDAVHGFGASPRSPSANTNEVAELREKLAKLEARLADEEKSKAGNRLSPEEEKARGKARLVAARARIQETRTALDSLDREITAWETRLPELLKGELGRRITSRKSAVDQFAALYEKPRMSREAAQGIREQLKALAEPVDGAGQGGELQSEVLLADLEKLSLAVQDSLRDYGERRVVIDTLLLDGGKTEPGKNTLQEAVQEYQADQARKRAEQIAVARKAAYDEVTKKLADMEEKAVKALGEIELKQNAVRQAEEKLKREQALAEAQKAVERKRLEASFEKALPEINRLLRAFTAEGYAQPSASGGFVRTAKKGPVSFGALQGAGLLKKEIDAVREFHRAAGHSSYNDRELGSFPRYLGGEQDFASKQATVQRAQDLLNEFGPLMVEKGMLAP